MCNDRVSCSRQSTAHHANHHHRAAKRARLEERHSTAGRKRNARVQSVVRSIVRSMSFFISLSALQNLIRYSSTQIFWVRVRPTAAQHNAPLGVADVWTIDALNQVSGGDLKRKN